MSAQCKAAGHGPASDAPPASTLARSERWQPTDAHRVRADSGSGVPPAPVVRKVLAAEMFPAKPEEVPRTRRLVRRVLGRYPAFDGELMELLDSELVTNCIRHSGTSWFWLLIATTTDGMMIAVADEGRGGRPRMRTARKFYDVGGRGLQIVHRAARRWGVVEGGHYVAVWCEVGNREETATFGMAVGDDS